MVRYTIFIGAFILCLFATSAFGQEPIVYPAKGQGQDQVEKDKYQCYSWAKQQTGFDPMKAPGQPQAGPSTQSTPMRGAAGGAAVGAVGGAIAGDAGKGAAIGAGAGAVAGGVKKRRQQEQQAQAQQMQSSAYSQARAGYNRAYGACMEGRGYTVK